MTSPEPLTLRHPTPPGLASTAEKCAACLLRAALLERRRLNCVFDAGARVPVAANAGVNVWWLYGASPLRFATVNVRESAGEPATLTFTGGRRVFSPRDFPGFGDAAQAAVEAAVALEFSGEAPMEDVTVDLCRSLVGRLGRAASSRDGNTRETGSRKR